MIKDWDQLTKELSGKLGELRAGTPEVMKGFSALAKAATAEGVLSEKTKELVALALGIAAHCDGCLAFHTKALARLGASRAEVMELIGMATYMGGGPSLMYGAMALEAFDQFTSARTPGN